MQKETTGEIIKRCQEITGMTQMELAAAITENRSDGGRITQSAISKWIRQSFKPSVYDIAAMDVLTRGKVSMFDFYPEIRDVYSRRKTVPMPVAADKAA